MAVLELTSHQEYLQLLQTKDKLIVVDFTAAWCGPCQVMKPVYHELSEKYSNAIFASLDVDNVPESAAMAKVTAMPTFQFYKQGKMVHQLKGANKEGLETVIKSLASAAAAPAAVEVVKGQIDLHSHLSNQIECLNFDTKHPVQNIFKDDSSVLKSDVDEQLLIQLEFNQPVKVHSIKFISPESGPKTVKTFVNQTTMSFEEAESTTGVDELQLKESDLTKETAPVGLRYVKYQYVHKLTIFVLDNQANSDCTVIERMIIYGTPIDDNKIEDIKANDPHQ